MVVVAGAARFFIESPYPDWHRLAHLDETWHTYIPHLGLEASERLAEGLGCASVGEAWQWLYATVDILKGIKEGDPDGPGCVEALVGALCLKNED